jgi:pimeloyl-ACP methyl ester carboxylesterase
MTIMKRSTFIAAKRSGLAVHEMSDGRGVPLVLLHPFPLDSRAWGPMVAQLPAGIRALGVDMPGFGKSDIGTIAPSIDLAADATFLALKDYGIGNAVIAGWSIGGYIALALADRHPGFVSGLGLVCTRAAADTEESAANRLRIAREVEMGQNIDSMQAWIGQVLGATSLANRRHLIPTLEVWMRGQPPTSIAWAQRAMARRPDRTRVLSEYKGPIAVIAGIEDSIAGPQTARDMATAANTGQLFLVPGAGHLAPLENPELVAKGLASLYSVVVPHVSHANKGAVL